MPIAGAVILLVALFAGANDPPPGISSFPDNGIERAAPEKCLFYFSSAGMVEPDAASTNHTEQILADKDVQTFFGELKTQIVDGFRQAGEKNELLADWLDAGLLPLASIALTRPAVFYVERFEIQAGGHPNVAAALILHCGDRAAEVRQIVDKIVALATREGGDDKIEEVHVAGDTLHRLATDDLQLDWGFHREFFLLAVGKQASADLLDRIDKTGSPPDWLTALKKQAGINRVGTVAFFNGTAVWTAIEPLIADPKIRDLLTLFRLNKFVSAGSVTGLDDEGMVTREFIDIGGWPAGATEPPPLTADDMKPIPENVEFATIARFDLGSIYQSAIEAAVQLGPGEEIKEKIGQLEQQLGFQIQADLLASLGDVWTVHSAPGVGLLPMSGLVFTVTLRDREKLAKVQDKLLAFAQILLAQQPEPPFAIETKNVRGLEVHHLQPHGPVAWDPAWAVVDGRMVFAATLQGLKFHIAHVGKKSLGELPAVAKRLESGPMMLSYQDSLNSLRQMFAAIQTFGPMFVGQLAAAGIKVELPTLPDLDAIESHILPRIDTTRRTTNGFESESFSTVPLASTSIGSPAAAGLLVALVLPAVQQARVAVHRNQSMNKLNRIGLAMHNHHDVYKRFPPTSIRDANGKPLLSWRVMLLPHLDEMSLYKEFHLDEPWDSEHNKPLLERMPDLYKNPRLGDLENKTVYLAPAGKQLVFSGNLGMNMNSVTDGISNTILVVVADPAKAVPWTKPDDLKIDADKPAAGLGRIEGDFFLVLAVDGSVHVLPGDIDSEILWGLFTPAGHEEIAWPNE